MLWRCEQDITKEEDQDVTEEQPQLVFEDEADEPSFSTFYAEESSSQSQPPNGYIE